MKKKYKNKNIKGLNFFEAIIQSLKKFFDFKGRASRSEYWYFQLLFTLTYMPIIVFEESEKLEDIIIALAITMIILIMPAITVSVRRFHDINRSGWFTLLNLIPYIGWIIVSLMLIRKGIQGKNRFGAYPLKLNYKK